MKKKHTRHRLGLPVDHERAPNFTHEVTPTMKGGKLELNVECEKKHKKKCR